MTEQEGRDRLRAKAGTTRQTRLTSESSSWTQCSNYKQYNHHKFRCHDPPVERKMAGREGLKAAGQASMCRAIPASAKYKPSPNLPKMERMGEYDGSIFVIADHA